MNTAAGVVGGLVVGAAVGFGAAKLGKHGGGAGPSAAPVAADSDAPVMELDGTKFKESDLPGDVRSSLFEARQEGYDRVNGLLNQFGLQLALAKDKGLAAKAGDLPPFDQLLDVPAPTDAEMKAIYEQNKARLPPDSTFEKIKPEIERYVKNQKMSEVLRQKNEEFKAKNRLVLLTQPPVAPQVQLELAPYASKGPSGSATTLVEVADYLCPHCQATQPDVEALLKDMGDKIRFVPVTFSLRPEGFSGTLARGAYCAKQQGDEAFWKYHGTAFATGKAKGWHAADKDDPALVVEVATAAGIDKGKLESCLNSAEAQAYVKNTVESFHRAGVSGTPTFFMNGRKLPLATGKSLKDNVLTGMQAASH